MEFSNSSADIFVPDGSGVDAAISRTTCMGIGAHQDDLEIMALHGILECFGRSDKWFTGVTCTDGAGSSRTGVYAGYSNEQMKQVRMQEQRAAAMTGRYSAIMQLGYTSGQTRDPAFPGLRTDLAGIIRASTPGVIYTHNPADKHPTHLAVFARTVEAIRSLPPDSRPGTVYGCEVWRDLDWLPDDRKIILDVGGHEGLANSLIGVYDSQVAGGKRYDLATAGRRRANATYLASHASDECEAVVFAVDLTPLICNDAPPVGEYVASFITEFAESVRRELQAVSA